MNRGSPVLSGGVREFGVLCWGSYLSVACIGCDERGGGIVW